MPRARTWVRSSSKVTSLTQWSRLYESARGAVPSFPIGRFPGRSSEPGVPVVPAPGSPQGAAQVAAGRVVHGVGILLPRYLYRWMRTVEHPVRWWSGERGNLAVTSKTTYAWDVRNLVDSVTAVTSPGTSAGTAQTWDYAWDSRGLLARC